MKFPKLYHAMEMWSVKMTAAGNPPFVAELAMGKVSYQNTVQLMTFLEDKKKLKIFIQKGQISLIAEFLKYCVGQCEHTLFALAMGLLEKLCPPSTHPLSVKMMEMCDELKKELQVIPISVNCNRRC